MCHKKVQVADSTRVLQLRSAGNPPPVHFHRYKNSPNSNYKVLLVLEERVMTVTEKLSDSLAVPTRR